MPSPPIPDREICGASDVHFRAKYRYNVGLEILSVQQMSATGMVLLACIFLAVTTDG